MAFTLIWHTSTHQADTLPGASVSFVAEGEIDETETKAIVRGLQGAGVKCDSVVAGGTGHVLHGAALEAWLKQAA